MDFIACFLFCLTSGILLYEFWGYPVLVVILSKIFPKHLNVENFVPDSGKTEHEIALDDNLKWQSLQPTQEPSAYGHLSK